MSRIRINSIIKSDENIIDKNFFGIKRNNCIIYIEDNIKTSITISCDSLLLKRENKEYEIELIFDIRNNTNGYYMIKEYNKKLHLDIITSKLLIDLDKIEVNYEIKNGDDILGKYEFVLKYKKVQKNIDT